MVLTGQLDDGTAGLWAVKDRGGLAGVQEAQDAFYPSMPQSALQHVAVDYCLPIDEIALTLVRLTGEPAPAEGDYPVSKALEIETCIAQEDYPMTAGVMQLGPLSPYTCPECHGVLLQLQEAGLLRFRCHTGHAFSASSLLAEVTASIEQLLSSTVRGIEESMLLLQHLARHTEEYSDRATAAYIRQKAQQAERRAALLRQAAREHEQLGAASLRGEPEAD
jgi:two-component system, chemotaxis family, protein-glutamate methylesterase/glutaminase